MRVSLNIIVGHGSFKSGFRNFKNREFDCNILAV